MPDSTPREPHPGGLPPLAAEDHVCPLCGLDYSSLTAEAAAGILAPGSAEVVTAARSVTPDLLRHRRDPRTWSVLEYTCHVRDVLEVHTIRLHRTRVEEVPTLEPMYNDLRARRFRYNNRDLPAVLDELKDAAAGLADEIDHINPEGWDRQCRRLAGELRSARWLVRNAAHEIRHHLLDIRSLAA